MGMATEEGKRAEALGRLRIAWRPFGIGAGKTWSAPSGLNMGLMISAGTLFV
ncbi:hypothetical protein SKA58_00205 [Sphingomonas sp. SKA58]|nr:hypothetical protein SKA58_00205 [Sphingomonas sp. SKA58]